MCLLSSFSFFYSVKNGKLYKNMHVAGDGFFVESTFAKKNQKQY